MDKVLKAPQNPLLAFIAVALIILGSRLIIINEHGAITPYWDDWGIGDFIYNAKVNGLSIEQLLYPTNGHYIFFGKLSNIILAWANGWQWDPFLIMVFNAVLWTLSGLFIIYATYKYRSTFNYLSFAAIALLVWVFPYGMDNIIWAAQSHNYFLILFIIVGCWSITSPALSKQWYLGLLILAAAPLTMGGGSFGALAATLFFFVKICIEPESRRQHIYTFLACLIISIYGLYIFKLAQTSTTSFSMDFLTAFLLTFLKSLAWPNHFHYWVFIAWIMPAFVLTWQIVTKNTRSTRLSNFALILFIFFTLIAFAIAYSRHENGSGPARRHFEFLSFSIISLSLSLLLIEWNTKHILFKKFLHVMLFLWGALFLCSFPSQIAVYNYTLNDRETLSPIHEKYVRNYLVDGDVTKMENRPSRHVPFPRAKDLARVLDGLKQEGMLPFQLQYSSFPTENPNDVFIANGVKTPVKELDPNLYKQPFISSYNISLEGNKATGQYLSEVFEINRQHVLIPVIGHLGYNGLSLNLINEANGEHTPINLSTTKPKVIDHLEAIFLKIPLGKYRLLAIDKSDEHWFGFAPPRPIGLLSLLVYWLLPQGERILQLGLLILLFCFRRQMLFLVR